MDVDFDKVTLEISICGDKAHFYLRKNNCDEPSKVEELGSFPLPIDDADQITLYNMWDTNILIVTP